MAFPPCFRVKPNGFGTLQCFQSSFERPILGSVSHTGTEVAKGHASESHQHLRGMTQYWRCSLIRTDWAGEGGGVVCVRKDARHAQFPVTKARYFTHSTYDTPTPPMTHPLHLCNTHSTFATPTAEDYVVLCPISELQASIYQSITDCDDVQLIVRSGEACDCFSGNDRGECCYVVREIPRTAM